MGLQWLTDQEQEYFSRILSSALRSDASNKELSAFLLRSGLPVQVTRDIAALVEKLQSREKTLTALKYVALAQARKQLKPGNLGQRVNLPRFDGVPYPASDQSSQPPTDFLPPAARASYNSRTKYLDDAFQDSPVKAPVLLKPLQSKVVPSEEDVPEPAEDERGNNPDFDLLDFAEGPLPPGKKVNAESYAQPDLLSDYFVPATKNSIARGGNKAGAFVFPTDQTDVRPKPSQSGTGLTNRLPAFHTRELAHRTQVLIDHPLTAREVLENEAELAKLRLKLIQFMRLEEAEKCQEHLELTVKIKHVAQQRIEALQRDVTEDAYEHQKIIINLKEKLATEKDVGRWMQPIPENRLTALYKQLKESLGAAAVTALKAEFHLDSLQPEKDIHSALVIVQEAFAVAETWLAVGAGHDSYSDVAQKVLSTTRDELSRAARLLPKLRQHLQLASQDANYDVYIRAIPMVFQLSDRVATSVRHLAKLYPAYLSLLPIIEGIAGLWRQCEPHLTVKKDADNKKAGARCGVCVHRGADLSHESCTYHAACLNWWIMRVEVRPPEVTLLT